MGTFGQGPLYKAADLDNLGKFGSDVVFGAGHVLRNRRADADGRRGDVLPKEHLGPALGRIEPKKLAVHGTDLLEQIQNPQRTEILQCLAKMFFQLWNVLLGFCERGVKS